MPKYDRRNWNCCDELQILNEAKTPSIPDRRWNDGGEELRAKYRYLDLRRNPIPQQPDAAP